MVIPIAGKKIDVIRIFIQFQKLVENLFNTKIISFQSDGHKEYDNGSFINHLVADDIFFVSLLEPVSL